MSTPQLPQRSYFYWSWFLWYVRRYLRKNFHAVRLSRGSSVTDLAGQPLLIVANHPSWWDPLVCAQLTTLFPRRISYAPFDAEALKKYPIFPKLGFYPIEADTNQGAIQFLRVTLGLLEKPDSAVWITAQGRFADVRERPVLLKPGVGHLAAKLTSGVILPLALEYTYWEERFPEALARFGPPLFLREGRDRSADEWTRTIAAALEATQDALRDDALSRNPGRFDTLLGGSVGIGGLYDWFRRGTAWFRGERFGAGHGKENTK